MANKKESKEPNSCMALNTIVMSPAAGPETPSLELESSATTVPPIIPAKTPVITEGKPSCHRTDVEANPIPRQSGSATKKTTKPAGRSCLQLLKNFNIRFD